MKKLITYIKNKIQHSKQHLKIKRQVSGTRELRAKRLSDNRRWEKNDVFHEDWNERTKLMGEMVAPDARVIEFGAGKAQLRNFLPGTVKYTPSDLVKREEDFLVCDLNRDIDFDLGSYDTLVFSGVLEYVYNVDKVFSQFPEKIQDIILSYTCADICSLNRLSNGWLSDYTEKELEDIFHDHNYQIKEKLNWKQQNIYRLQRKS